MNLPFIDTNVTVNQLVAIFEEIAANHGQIQGFGYGQEYDVAAVTESYPLLWVWAQPSKISNQSMKFIFRVNIMDLVKPEGIGTQQTQVQSDTINTLWDIAFLLRDYYDLQITFDINVTPFTERFNDRVTGWFADFSIEVPQQFGVCDVPFKSCTSGNTNYSGPYPYEPFGCGCALYVENTASISWQGSGTTCDPSQAFVNISKYSGNSLMILPDGLYATGGAGGLSGVTTADTPSIILYGAGTISSPLSGATNVSANAGNELRILPDGLYVSSGATSPGGSNTDIQYNNNGVFGGNGGFRYDGTAVYMFNDLTIYEGEFLLAQPSGAGIEVNSAHVLISEESGGYIAMTPAQIQLSTYQGSMVMGSGFVGIQTAALSFYLNYTYFELAGGALQINNLAGSGTRLVVTDSTGILSAQVIPNWISGVTTQNTNSVDLSGIGIIGNPLQANVNISPVSGNTVQVLSGGLYVSGATGSVPGGLSTDIQFNSGGTFGGSSKLTWNGSLLYIEDDAIGQIPAFSSGLKLNNPTASTNSINETSPVVSLITQGWSVANTQSYELGSFLWASSYPGYGGFAQFPAVFLNIGWNYNGSSISGNTVTVSNNYDAPLASNGNPIYYNIWPDGNADFYSVLHRGSMKIGINTSDPANGPNTIGAGPAAPLDVFGNFDGYGYYTANNDPGYQGYITEACVARFIGNINPTGPTRDVYITLGVAFGGINEGAYWNIVNDGGGGMNFLYGSLPYGENNTVPPAIHFDYLGQFYAKYSVSTPNVLIDGAQSAFIGLADGNINQGGIQFGNTSPALLSSPTKFVLETDGSYLYFTDSTPVRHKLSFGGGVPTYVVSTTTSAYAVTLADQVILVDATSGPITITLLAAASAHNQGWTVKKIDASSNHVTIVTGGGNIDGGASAVITTQYASVDMVSDNSNYWII